MMLVISDTNILSSFAAAQAFPLLQQLFAKSVIYIPPAVRQELEVGLNYGQAHLKVVLDAITSNQLQILDLSASEKHLAGSLPRKLNAGESEAQTTRFLRRPSLYLKHAEPPCSRMISEPFATVIEKESKRST